MGSNGATYNITFSNEIKNYYNQYYGVSADSDIAELTYIQYTLPGASSYTLTPLYSSTDFNYSEGRYSYTVPEGEALSAARFYFYAPWRWSKLSSDQSADLPTTWTQPKGKSGWNVDYLDWIFSDAGQKAINGGSMTSFSQPNPVTFPAPFQYIETNAGEGKSNNIDLSLINGYTLPLSIENNPLFPDSFNTITEGVRISEQEQLWKALGTVTTSGTRPQPSFTPPGQPSGALPVIFDWVTLDPEDASTGQSTAQYDNLLAYLKFLAINPSKYDSKNPTAYLFCGVSGVECDMNAYFFVDNNGLPYIILDGSSGVTATGESGGLLFIPWDESQIINNSPKDPSGLPVVGPVLTKFREGVGGAGAGVGLSSPNSIYGNAGVALYLPNERLTDLTNPYDLKEVITFFNDNEAAADYYGNSIYGGELFFGLNYGLIGSEKQLTNTKDFSEQPTSGINYPSGSDWSPLSTETAIGKLPSSFWWANGQLASYNQSDFVGPIASGQIGANLWSPEATKSNAFWNTYSVAIRENLFKLNPDNALSGPYTWAMDDRMGGNLVYSTEAGNYMQIEIGAPYTQKSLIQDSPIIFEKVGIQYADITGRWITSSVSTNKGTPDVTVFVSEAEEGASIGGQTISLIDSSGTAITGTQFTSSVKSAGSMNKALGRSLFSAISLSEFQDLAAKTEEKSIGASNLKRFASPQADFGIQVSSQQSTDKNVSLSEGAGVFTALFNDSVAVSISSGIFNLFGLTSPEEVAIQATSVGGNSNILFAYRVDSVTGAILSNDGSWIKPSDIGYARAALSSQNLLRDDTLILKKAQSTTTFFDESTTEDTDLFALAVITNGSIDDFLTTNKNNEQGKGPNAFFSIGAANPDGMAHMISLDSGVVAFEDLWGGGDMDYNDVVIAFKGAPIT
jgi:hypothetical protein